MLKRQLQLAAFIAFLLSPQTHALNLALVAPASSILQAVIGCNFLLPLAQNPIFYTETSTRLLTYLVAGASAGTMVYAFGTSNPDYNILYKANSLILLNEVFVGILVTDKFLKRDKKKSARPTA